MFTTHKINLILALVNFFIPFSQFDIHVEKFGYRCVCQKEREREFFVCCLNNGPIWFVVNFKSLRKELG